MTNMQATETTPNERLLIARRRAHLEVQVVARELGVTRKTISSWESGKSEPTASNIRRLAEVLGVSVSWLLMGDAGDTSVGIGGQRSTRRYATAASMHGGAGVRPRSNRKHLSHGRRR